MNQAGIYSKYIKRLLDIVLSALALAVLSPLLLLTALLVRIKLGSPVVFKQARPGMNEKIFYLYKFRSMTNKVDEEGRLLPDAQRLTKFGKLLRASSLDELLELINIIRGDMSIVGPRPLSIYYLPHYPPRLRKRHAVRPGLTGLAQINGRNNLLWNDRFELDIKYVESISFWTDARIILDTVLKVLKRADVTVRGTTDVMDYGPYKILNEEKNGGVRMAGMTYSEIGSYFWLDGQENSMPGSHPDWLPAVSDSCFAFSGRNAIDIALRDILHNRSIHKVFAPSYCCVAMLQPFIDRGLKVGFYDVGYQDGRFTYQIPEADEHSVVLIMSYFGLTAASAHDAVKSIHSKGAVIMEDITHSLLRQDQASEYSDYLVVSLRKWFATPAGSWVGKRNGALAEKPDIDSNHAVQDKIDGMREKYDYLSGKADKKDHFLLTNAKFENDLIHVDRMLKIDDLSLSIVGNTDVESVIAQRRKNAAVLLNGLKDLENRILTLPEVDLSADVPLFVPVFMKTEKRDELKQYLIDKGIYCPVHWPEVMGAEPGVRLNELSLICDQRYSEGDMTAIVETIHAWYQNQA